VSAVSSSSRKGVLTANATTFQQGHIKDTLKNTGKDHFLAQAWQRKQWSRVRPWRFGVILKGLSTESLFVALVVIVPRVVDHVPCALTARAWWRLTDMGTNASRAVSLLAGRVAVRAVQVARLFLCVLQTRHRDMCVFAIKS